MDDREKDEFDRFRLAARLDRDYDLGKLDERLEGGS